MITQQHILEARCIQASFQNEIALWTKKPAKMVIFGEAPLSCDKYFYNQEGNYLSFLKPHYNFTNRAPGSFKAFLRQKGILTVEIYQYPLSPAVYRADVNNQLFNVTYFCNEIKKLQAIGMIDNNTIFVFRYRMLINRGLPALIKNCLPNKGANLISNQPIAIRANAMTLNPNLVHVLP